MERENRFLRDSLRNPQRAAGEICFWTLITGENEQACKHPPNGAAGATRNTCLFVLAGHKPQPPPPVNLFFDSARYTISCKSPSSPDPQSRRIPRACGHMRRPWKRDRNPTSPSLRTQNSKLEPCSKLQSEKTQLKASNPKAKTATQNLNRSLVLSSFRSQ